MKKLIKSNNHSELVISSSVSFPGALEAFTEGLVLGIYSFSKYKTKKEREDKYNYPAKLLILDTKDEVDARWLSELTDAVYFVRDLINEPVNHLNAPALAGALARLAADPALRRQMGVASRRLIETELGWPQLARRYVAHFEGLGRKA